MARLRSLGYPRQVVDAYRGLVAEREERRLGDKAAEAAEENDPRAPRRWGDRKVVIDQVRLLGADGRVWELYYDAASGQLLQSEAEHAD